MADIAGINCVLKVGDGASPEVFTTLEGQTDTTFDGSTNVADTTNKSNNGWQTGLSTTLNGTVSANGALQDTRTQMDILEAAWLARTTVNCQIVFDTTGKGYEGPFYVTQLNISAPTTDVVRYSVTLTPAGALTQIP